MDNTFKLTGKIIFDPPNITGKHKEQGKWKKVAYISFKGEHCQYYQWFIKKRYNLILGDPIRGAHITIINDSHRDMGDGYKKWNDVKKKWNKKSVEIELSPDVRSDGINWWLVVNEKSRKNINGIRAELNLGRPYFGLHMTIGVARDAKDEVLYQDNHTVRPVRKNEEHSKYILGLLTKKLIK